MTFPRGPLVPVLLAALSLGSTVVAQNQVLPTPKAPQSPVERLTKQRDRLKNEIVQIARLKQQGGLEAQLKDRFQNRTQEIRSIEVATAAPAPVSTAAPNGVNPAGLQPTKPAGAGLMSDADKAQWGDDVIALVESLPVTQAEFQTLFDYLRAGDPEAEEAPLERRAMTSLLSRKLARARAGEKATKALSACEKLLTKLEAGADFAKMAREHSEGPSSVNGGDLGLFGPGRMDLNFEVGAFALEEGEISGLVESPFGIHIIKRTGTGENGQIRASHILKLFNVDTSAAAAAMNDVANGRARVLFRDAAWRAKSSF